MKKYRYSLFAGIIFLVGSSLFTGCDELMYHDTGFIEGKISIGPLCPVETDPPDPGCLPTAETYNSYPVGVWTSDGRIKVAQINPALDGTYKTELATGNYLVILENGQSRIGSSNLPVHVTISALKNENLDINIDTGIR